MLGLLGAYASVTDDLDFATMPRWFVYHLADTDLLVAVAPFGALISICLLAVRRVTSTRELRLLVAVSVPALATTLIVVSAFHRRFLSTATTC